MRRFALIRLFLWLAASLAPCGVVLAQSTALPQCPGTYSRAWTNCQGTQVNSRGDRYVGAFRNGEYEGLGSLSEADGFRYVGEFRQGRRAGRGVLYFANGDRYA
ncbi:MAG: hypothetical protein RIS88_1570, partial [Pseudomonadota bacterium]